MKNSTCERGACNQVAESLLDALAEVIAERVAVRVAATVAKLSTSSDVYTSIRLPLDVKTRARFNRLAPSVPGARRNGRVWIVPCASWEAFRTRRVAGKEPTGGTAADDADELLAGAGLRPVLRVVGSRR